MREAAGPRPAMAPPAAFIPPTLLLLFIIGPAAPKEGENRRDPKTNFFPLLFSFPPPPSNFIPLFQNFFLFLPLPPIPIFCCFSLFFWGGVEVAMKLDASLPESSQRFGL